MRFNGKNLEEVLNAHWEWICCPIDDSQRADFSGCDLRGHALPYTSLFGANFRGANLYHADLFCADLQKADLTGANLYEANLYGTKLRGAIGIGYIPQRVPTHGSFIAWKRAKTKFGGTHYDHSVIVKLLIPEDADRISLINGECKASRAEVLEIQTIEGEPLPDAIAISIRDGRTRYKAGETVIPSEWVPDPFAEHTPGIFFYLDRDQAVRYLTSGDDADGKVNPLDLSNVKEEYKDTWMQGTPPNVLDYLIGDDLREMLFALKTLPFEQAAAIVLKYYDRYPIEIVADRLEKSVEETEALLQRARDTIDGVA